MTMKGAFIAAAVAGLFTSATPVIAFAKHSSKVECQGVNACKGKGGCKSATNECKGQNGCKGKGWIKTSAKACAKKGGTVVSANEGGAK